MAITDTPETPIGGLHAALLAHRAQLIRFFSSRTGDSAEAEDIVQEIWFKIERAQTGPLGDPLSYLYRVGLNIVVDRVRERQRRAKREATWVDQSVNRIGPEAVDDSLSPLAALEEQQRAQQIATAIAALPPGAGRVFRRHRIDGLSHGEIAAELAITTSAVEKHMAVALRHLTKALRE